MSKAFYALLLCPLFFACKGGRQAIPTKKPTTVNLPTTNILPADSTIKKEVSPEQLILPGKAIGRTTLNEDATLIAKVLGPPDKGDAAMGKALSTWYANHDPTGYQTSIFFERQMGGDETSRAKQIRITSP